jgi:hypothetical protein
MTGHEFLFGWIIVCLGSMGITYLCNLSAPASVAMIALAYVMWIVGNWQGFDARDKLGKKYGESV